MKKQTNNKAIYQDRLLFWYFSKSRELPWREDFAKFRSPYHVWVSEIFLQQTQIATVIPAYLRFVKQLPDVNALARCSEEKLRSLVQGMGYYRRFFLLRKGAQQVVALSKNSRQIDWPKNFEEWLQLAGIGEYTASAISSIAYGEPRAVVDGNVERVFCRLYDIRLPSNERSLKPRLKQLAAEFLYEKNAGDFNQAMMQLGQLLCTKTQPKCQACPLAGMCQSKANASQALAPAPRIRPSTEIVELEMFIPFIRERKQVVLTRRSDEAKFLKGSWGFLTAAKGVQASRKHANYVGSFRHHITRHKLKVDVFHLDEDPKQDETKSVRLSKVDEVLMTNLDRKAWQLWETHNLRDRNLCQL